MSRVLHLGWELNWLEPLRVALIIKLARLVVGFSTSLFCAGATFAYVWSGFMKHAISHLLEFKVLARRVASSFRACRTKSVRCRTHSNIMHTNHDALTLLYSKWRLRFFYRRNVPYGDMLTHHIIPLCPHLPAHCIDLAPCWRAHTGLKLGDQHGSERAWLENTLLIQYGQDCSLGGFLITSVSVRPKHAVP
jgi:hypothetical protein